MKTELEKMDILRLSNEESNKVTRECLRIAMFKLMGKEEFDKISITELTKYAGVSRVAFYRNYESKEALVEDLCQTLFKALQLSLTGELYLSDRRQWYENFFRTIHENSEYFAIYLKAGLRLTDGLMLEFISPSTTVEERYANAAREGAFTGILIEWFRAGMTPDDVLKAQR